MAIDWTGYKDDFDAAGKRGLKAWQYLAACYLGCTEDTVDQRDAQALEVGRRCHERTAAGESTCVWHEAHLLFDNGRPCPCATCSPQARF